MAAPERGQPGTWQHLALWRENGDMHLDATLAGLPSNDLMAAAMVAGLIWPGQLHHAPDASRWYVWNGKCHQPDDSSEIDRRVQLVARWYGELLSHAHQQLTAEVAASMPGADAATVDRAVKMAWSPWEPAAKYGMGLHRSAGLTALRMVLAGRCGMSESELEDRWPGHLNVDNGILDMATGQVWPHDPRAMMTYALPIAYNPAAQCPQYSSLLLRACGGNQQVAAFLVKLLGYSLHGGNPHQVIAFLRGPTASGKSALLNVAVKVMGELAHESSTQLITVQRFGRNARVENSIRGRRLVAITEASGHLILDEAQLKRLTGEKVVAIDRHYSKEQLRSKVVWLILLATNEMASLANPDEALQRRMLVVPMGASLPEWERMLDIDDKIAAEEAEGVLALLVWGYQQVMAEGLQPPPEVIAASAEYAAEQNTVDSFVKDCCIIRGASVNGQGPARAGMHRVWQAYEWYTQRSGARLPKMEFKQQFSRYPGVQPVENRRWYEGVELQPWVESEL